VYISNEARDLVFKLCTDPENRLDSEQIKTHSFFKNFDFGPNLRRIKAPYIPSISHPTDTSNFETVKDSVIADRMAKLEEMNRNQQRNLFNNHDMNESGNTSISNVSLNPMLYEFTFRRFFDEVTDNMHRSNEDNNGLKYFIRSVSSPSKNKLNSIKNNYSNELESVDNQMEMSDKMEEDYVNENSHKNNLSPNAKTCVTTASNNQHQFNIQFENNHLNQNHQTQILSNIINEKSNENIHLNSESINGNKYFNYNNPTLNTNNNSTKKNNENQNQNQSAIFV
jgi:hypothetical protein